MSATVIFRGTISFHLGLLLFLSLNFLTNCDAAKKVKTSWTKKLVGGTHSGHSDHSSIKKYQHSWCHGSHGVMDRVVVGRVREHGFDLSFIQVFFSLGSKVEDATRHDNFR